MGWAGTGLGRETVLCAVPLKKRPTLFPFCTWEFCLSAEGLPVPATQAACALLPHYSLGKGGKSVSQERRKEKLPASCQGHSMCSWSYCCCSPSVSLPSCASQTDRQGQETCMYPTKHAAFCLPPNFLPLLSQQPCACWVSLHSAAFFTMPARLPSWLLPTLACPGLNRNRHAACPTCLPQLAL